MMPIHSFGKPKSRRAAEPLTQIRSYPAIQPLHAHHHAVWRYVMRQNYDFGAKVVSMMKGRNIKRPSVNDS